ncbi:MAG TPA: alpha/beta hydrolase, partial [Myxococcales bacterium]
VDYPGYGKSGGSVPRNEDELQMAGAALYDAALAAEHGDERRIVVYGRSLGTAVATRLAAQRNPAALVLETPFDSLRSLAQRLFPWAPTFLIRYPFRSDLDAAKIRCPTLILHGTADEVVPFAQGARLAKRIPQATFIAIHDGRHNDLSNFPTYWTAVTRFLTFPR